MLVYLEFGVVTLWPLYFFWWCGIHWRVQSNSFVEGVSHKIRRQIEELERVSGGESSALTVDGVPVDSYLTRWFVWVSVDLCWVFDHDPSVPISNVCVFVVVGLFGTKPSTQPCHLWGRSWMAFMAKWLKLKMISKYDCIIFLHITDYRDFYFFWVCTWFVCKEKVTVRYVARKEE